MAEKGTAEELTEDDINGMVIAFDRIRELETGMMNIENAMSLVTQAITTNIAANPEKEEEIRAIYEERLLKLAKLYQKQVSLF